MSHARHRIIYIHGYEAKGKGYLMPAIESLVRRTLPNTNKPDWVEHWSPLSDTKKFTFKEVAEQLAKIIREGGAYEKQYAVCHSMGGLIARQMCLMPGVRFDGILTLCSPHEGTARWISVGSDHADWYFGAGPKSLIAESPDLRALNESDEKYHRLYHCVGVQCFGKTILHNGLNENDTVVELKSQHLNSLNSTIQRYTMCVDYGNNDVPQGATADKLCPHNFVVDHAVDTAHGHISFDNSPLINAIRNCIKL